MMYEIYLKDFRNIPSGARGLCSGSFKQHFYKVSSSRIVALIDLKDEGPGSHIAFFKIVGIFLKSTKYEDSLPTLLKLAGKF